MRRDTWVIPGGVGPHLVGSGNGRRPDIQPDQNQSIPCLGFEPQALEAGDEARRSSSHQTTGVGPVKIEMKVAPGVIWISSSSSNRRSTFP